MITTIDNRELIIGDHNAHFPEIQHLIHAYQGPDGKVRAKGLIPRPADWKTYKRPMKSVDMPVFDESDWPAMLADQIKKKMRCSDIRNRGNGGKPIPSLDQDGVGYCWAHSPTNAHTVLRAKMNLPYIPLSAFCVAATIKNGRDEGGWGALALDFIMDKGQASQDVWPQGDRNYRKYDKPEVWSDAAKHKITTAFYDQSAQPYDRNLAFKQRATLFLCSNPDIGDYNWWSHSVCGLDLVNGTSLIKKVRHQNGKLVYRTNLRLFEITMGLHNPVTAGYGVRIWNSWGDSWEDNGTGVLTGSKAEADGCVAPVSAKPSELIKLHWPGHKLAA